MTKNYPTSYYYRLEEAQKEYKETGNKDALWDAASYFDPEDRAEVEKAIQGEDMNQIDNIQSEWW